LTTFIDHRHDPHGEELALAGITGGRAGNGTNDQQLGHFGDACFAGTRPIAKKVLDDSHPTERPKWVGSREFCSPRETQAGVPEPRDEPFEPQSFTCQRAN